MQKPNVSLIFLVLLGFSFFRAAAFSDTLRLQIGDTLYCGNEFSGLKEFSGSSESLVLIKDETNKKKFVSAFFAFPFPFGFMGAHRVMLGCPPWVPVVYVATFGGCFGLLPLIDFCVILLSKDIEQYENNPQIFMWVK